MMSWRIQFLDWDTQFFGKRIGRVMYTTLNAEAFHDIDAEAHAQQLDCLYLLLDATAIPAIHLAEASAYHLNDIRITFEQKIAKSLLNTMHTIPESVVLRDAKTTDLPVLLPIARSAYIHSRFYNDPNFDDVQCAALYEEWLRKSILTDFANGVRVAVVDDMPVAYTTYVVDEATQIATIGLVGVAEEARGKQLGTLVIEDTLRQLLDADVRSINVVTQGSNIGAQKLYERTGFLSKKTELWYHKWYHDTHNTQ